MSFVRIGTGAPPPPKRGRPLPHQKSIPGASGSEDGDQADHGEDDDHDDDDIPGGHVAAPGIGSRDHILRADLELELEQALARVRQVRLDNDAAMAETLAGLDSQVLLRYRQLESWREILRRGDGGQMVPAALAAMLVSGQPGDGRGGFGLDGSATEPGVGNTP